MRTNRLIAIVVASLVSGASVAHAQVSAPQSGHASRSRGQKGEGHGAHGLLRGISLSDAEKGRLKEIHAKYTTEASPLRASLRPAMQEARALRLKGDSAGAKAAWQKTAVDREKLKAIRLRERSELRSALAPQNQQTFDANVTRREQRRAARQPDGAGGRGGRGGRGGHRMHDNRGRHSGHARQG